MSTPVSARTEGLFKTALTRLRQWLGPIFLRAPIGFLADPISRVLLPFVYTLKFAKWFNENSLKSHLLATNRRFGYHNRYELYTFVVNFFKLGQAEINYLEFGVASGEALRWWVDHNKNTASTFVGFDTFQGLPEDWGSIPRGTFSTNGQPPTIGDDRCSFQIGLFQETLPEFLEAQSLKEARTVVHMDADLYSATLFVLLNLASKLKRGDIVIFDEFADVMHEFRAYVDFLSSCRIDLQVIKAVNFGHKVAFVVAK